MVGAQTRYDESYLKLVVIPLFVRPGANAYISWLKNTTIKLFISLDPLFSLGVVEDLPNICAGLP